MKFIFTWMQARLDDFVRRLFNIIMDKDQLAHSYVTRFAITFLDVWQAIIIVNHNYWIPQLVDVNAPLQAYTIFAVLLAFTAIVAMILTEVLWLSAFVLAVNWVFYLLLGIAGLWYSDPPRASSGFSFVIFIISISSFWRILLLILRNRATNARDN